MKFDAFKSFQDDYFGCNPTDLPFTESIGMRGPIVTFESQFSEDQQHDQGVEDDVRFLAALKLGSCAYGACDPDIHPFLCELPSERETTTASDILTALKVKNFRSEHIKSLDEIQIPFPGYNPDTENDEIHNDFLEQFIFSHDKADENEGSHGMLKQYVTGGHIWYVLLHPRGQEKYTNFVILFAIGKSPNGRRLVGVITQQACHNLCD